MHLSFWMNIAKKKKKKSTQKLCISSENKVQISEACVQSVHGLKKKVSAPSYNCNDKHGEQWHEGARRQGILQMNRPLIKQKGKELRQAETYT